MKPLNLVIDNTKTATSEQQKTVSRDHHRELEARFSSTADELHSWWEPKEVTKQ